VKRWATVSSGRPFWSVFCQFVSAVFFVELELPLYMV
jgi:hypothetical protein